MNIDILSTAEAEKMRRLIDLSDKIVIVCHCNPDGDALGSMLAWADYLRDCGKAPVSVVPDAYPDFLQWLPGSERLMRYDKYKSLIDGLLNDAQLIFCLDFNTASRTDSMTDALSAAKAQKVMIDHHLNPDMQTAICVSHPEASSTSELVFRIIWQLGGYERMGKKCAVPIYCGMMTDTGGFTYNSTRPEIFFIISQLLCKNVNKDKIYRNVYNNYSEQRMRLMGNVLYEKLVTMPAQHASYFILKRQDLKRFRYIKGDAEGLVNIPLQIKGMKLSISIREDTERDNLAWVSLRSVDDFPCNLMAEQFFNGGGHLNAAGGRYTGPIEKAEEYVKDAVVRFCSQQ